MHHSVKMILILQMGLVKPNEQQVVKIAWPFLKLWDNGNFQLSSAWELIAEQGLTCTV